MIRPQTKSELITASFIDLLNQRSFHSITIKDITDNCGISRRTFYNCFKDKYDVVVYLYNTTIDMDAAEDACNPYTYWLSIYNKKKSHAAIWQKILSDSLCREFIQSSLYTAECNFFKRNYREFNLTNYFKTLFKFHSSGLLQLFYDWIMGNCKETPDEMAKITVNTFPPDIKQLYSACNIDDYGLLKII